MSGIYAHYGLVGGWAIAPEVLLGLLFYGYATGVFSSRKIEGATYESIPFRFIAGGLHPDHDTIANFEAFLPEIEDLFAQILLVAHESGALTLGNISLDGTKIHADASKSHAVSYKRLLELEGQLRQQVEELLRLAEQTDQSDLPEGLSVADEIAFRERRLANLGQAKAVLEARAQERYPDAQERQGDDKGAADVSEGVEEDVARDAQERGEGEDQDGPGRAKAPPGSGEGSEPGVQGGGQMGEQGPLDEPVVEIGQEEDQRQVEVEDARQGVADGARVADGRREEPGEQVLQVRDYAAGDQAGEAEPAGRGAPGRLCPTHP